MQEVRGIQIFLNNVENYFQLGLNLGLDHQLLHDIDIEFQQISRRKIEVFEKWRKVQPDASIEDLLEALEAMQENHTAKNIKQKYCGEHPTGIFSEHLLRKLNLC